MKRLWLAASAAVVCAAAPAMADPLPYLSAGQFLPPVVSLGICGSTIVGGVTLSTPCAPGMQPPITFLNASGVLTQVSTANPLPTSGSGGGGASSSVTQGTSPWVDNVTQIGGAALALGQATRAASIPVTLATDQPAIAVSGAFFQATQPVSGTFWQATQPVSGAFFQATQPVSLASLPPLAAGSAAIGTVGVSSLPATPSYAPGTCSATTVGTTPTKVIDTVASGVSRNGGGFQLYSTAPVPIVYSWIAGANLTAATAGAYVLAPGGTISFAGAPNTALYAIVQSGSASVSGGCMTE